MTLLTIATIEDGLSHKHTGNGSGNVSVQVDRLIEHRHITLTGDTTIEWGQVHPNGVLYLMLEQGGAGGYTVTWPAGTKWAGGVAPTLSTTVGAMDNLIIGFMSGVAHEHGRAMDVK